MRTVAETGSTNADMLALARSGVEEGVWLRAERQTGGRGRQGRVWVSPIGNFYGSTVVRVRGGDPAAATLALVAAVALEEVVRVYLSLFPRRRPGPSWGGRCNRAQHCTFEASATGPRPAPGKGGNQMAQRPPA